MSGHGRKDVDEALVLALAAGSGVAAAARKAGVSERTVRRRLQEEAFAARVDGARARMVQRAVGRLAAAGGLAGKTLHELLRSQSDTVRLGAAHAALEFMFRGHEQDTLVRQVEDIQRQLEAVKRRGQGSDQADA
jgi:predicted transcriptional regulator